MRDEIAVPTQFGDNSNCRSVKCDSYVTDTTINIIVVYEIFNPTTNGWDIGATRVWWYPGGFPNENSVQLDDPDILAALSDERWPDIAIDQSNGIGIIVFSDYLQNIPNTRVVLGYRRKENITNSNMDWSPYYHITDPATPNSQMPRVDIGILDNIYPEGPVNCVAVAYMAQYCDIHTPDQPHNGFHIHFLCGRHDLVDGDLATGVDAIRVCLRNPVGFDPDTWTPGDGTHENPGNTFWLDAGMPYIDIAPSGNENHYGVITFTQVVGNDNYGPITTIWTADAKSLWFTNLTDAQDGWADGMYPSMAWHYGEDWASLTYFRQRPFTDEYHPWIARIEFPDPPVIALGSSRPIGNANDFITSGILNLSQVQFLNPGAATAICTLGNHNYWAAWCDRLQMEPAPTTVMAAWGNSGAN